MVLDPTEEIKTIRHRMGAELGFDLHRIIEDNRQRQQDSGREYIRLPKRDPRITMRCTGATKPSVLPIENQSSSPGDA
jgi:hypothetical protein